jgi:hypothetical protein
MRNFISSKYHNVGSTTSSAPVPLFSESFIRFNSFLKSARRELSFYQHPEISLYICEADVRIVNFVHSVAVILALDIPQSR